MCGIVLMAYADNAGEKSLFACTSSSLSKVNWKENIIGKSLLLLMYFPLLFENINSSSWIRLSLGLCLVVINIVGYRINIFSVLMIVWLMFGNFPSTQKAYYREFWYEDPTFFFLINTLLTTGGFLLLLAYGSENIDSKKKS